MQSLNIVRTLLSNSLASSELDSHSLSYSTRYCWRRAIEVT